MSIAEILSLLDKLNRAIKDLESALRQLRGNSTMNDQWKKNIDQDVRASVRVMYGQYIEAIKHRDKILAMEVLVSSGDTHQIAGYQEIWREYA
jgi:uncharacterized oligopeptide transporter (OPT) family protein